MIVEQITQDIARLTSNPLPHMKADIAARTVDYALRDDLQTQERTIVNDLLRKLMEGGTPIIRQIISCNLKSSTSLPDDIMMELLQDKDIAISAPLLRYSPLLHQACLLDIIEKKPDTAVLCAIAEREPLASALVEALIHTANEEAIIQVIRNPKAQVTDAIIDILVDHYQAYDSHKIIHAFLYRHDVSAVSAKKLCDLAPESISKALIEQFGDTDSNQGENNSVEQKILPLSRNDIHHHHVESQVTRLHENERLCNATILQALCKGNLHFFILSTAKLADISIDSAKMIIGHPQQEQFGVLMRYCNIPTGSLEAVRVILNFVLTEHKHGVLHHEGFEKRLLTHIITNEYDNTIDNMYYMITLINTEPDQCEIA